IRLIVPADSSAELCTSQGSLFVAQRRSVMSSPGGPLNVDESEIPFSIAAARVKGLKALPAWRRPCDARLNWRRSPLGTWTAIALIFPLRGSIATSADAG